MIYTPALAAFKTSACGERCSSRRGMNKDLSPLNALITLLMKNFTSCKYFHLLFFGQFELHSGVEEGAPLTQFPMIAPGGRAGGVQRRWGAPHLGIIPLPLSHTGSLRAAKMECDVVRSLIYHLTHSLPLSPRNKSRAPSLAPWVAFCVPDKFPHGKSWILA